MADIDPKAPAPAPDPAPAPGPKAEMGELAKKQTKYQIKNPRVVDRRPGSTIITYDLYEGAMLLRDALPIHKPRWFKKLLSKNLIPAKAHWRWNLPMHFINLTGEVPDGMDELLALMDRELEREEAERKEDRHRKVRAGDVVPTDEEFAAAIKRYREWQGGGEDDQTR